MGLNTMFGPFRAWVFTFSSSQGVALGWYVAAPSGRNPRSATSKRASEGSSCRSGLRPPILWLRLRRVVASGSAVCP